MSKHFCKTSDEMIRILPDLGAAIVTDRIVVDGESVGCMAHSEPAEEVDSGWVFYAGDENQEHLDNPDNTSVMALNTIANFDHSIIPFIMVPPGTEVERNISCALQVVGGQTKKPAIRFLMPAFPGIQSLTESWEVQTKEHMLQRVEDGDLVIWRPGLIFYVTCFSSKDQGEDELVADFMKNVSEDAQNFVTGRLKGFTRILV